jgi:lipoprotein NlpI
MRLRKLGIVVGFLMSANAVFIQGAWAGAAEDAYDEGVRLVQAGRQREAIPSFDKAIRLNASFAAAYNGRGIALHEIGQHEQAIKNYGEAIRLNERFAEAYYNRGNAYSDLGQYDRAVNDYSQAIRLNADYSGAYYNRAIAYIFLAQGDAAADARSYLNLKGWKDERSQYMVIFGHLSERRERKDTQGRQILADAATNCDTSVWPYPVIRYLGREISSEDLLAAATDRDKQTEARTYIGLDLSLSEKRDEALTYLQWVRDSGNKDFAEYGFAVAELRRLETHP